MFSNLIESGSHAADLKRKGRFFLGATVFYALLLASAGVGSIYAYNAKLEDPSDYEVYALLRFPPAEARPEPERPAESRPAASNSREMQIASRTEISVITPFHGDRVASESARDINARTPVVIGRFNTDPEVAGGPANTNYASGPGGPGVGAGPAVSDNVPPPPPPARAEPTPTPARQTGPVRLTSEVLTGKATSKPAPPYPAVAKQLGVQGSVAVQVLIDEQGRVLSAKATSGHPLLQAAAVQAAYRASFTPTTLSGQPVKVSGIITYNFVLNR
jgi:protein TonB